MKHKVKIKYLNEKCKLKKATDGSIGYDMRANITEPIKIRCGETVVIPLGVSTDLGNPLIGLFLFDRSGLARHHGIQLMNGVGVVDGDFRGEAGAILYNTGSTGEAFIVEPYDRIVQCIFIESADVELEETDELSETERGTGGYSSTGIK